MRKSNSAVLFALLSLIFIIILLPATGEKLSAYTVGAGQSVALDPAYQYRIEGSAAEFAGGKLTGKNVGNAVLIITDANGNETRTPVTVVKKGKGVTALKLKKTYVELKPGKKATVSASVTPSGAKNRKIVWSSSDPSVATVTQKGVIRAVSVGRAVISATASSGITKTVSVNVTSIMPSSVRLNRSTASLKYGKQLQLSAQVKPANAADRSVRWKSSNANVLTVSDTGLVTAVGKGTATVTATACNGKKASCRINVKFTPVSGLTLKTNVLYLTTGSEPQPLSVTVKPAAASIKTVRWSSSDPAVATVDENGTVTPVGAGEAKITSTSVQNGKLKAVCTVHVREKKSDLPLSGLRIGVNAGHQRHGNNKMMPIAPGSKKTRAANSCGATGKKTRIPEYETNLQISLYLQQYLIEAGAEVVMIRTTHDVNICNIDRAKILNNAGCDLAIQVHCNSSSKKSTNGIRLYVRNTGVCKDESLAIAKAIGPAMAASSGAVYRATTKSDYYPSMNWSTIPAVLLECGYLSNPQEDVLLNTPSYQQALAHGVVDGLISYFSK